MCKGQEVGMGMGTLMDRKEISVVAPEPVRAADGGCRTRPCQTLGAFGFDLI